MRLSSHLPVMAESFVNDQRVKVLSIRFCIGLAIHCWWYRDEAEHGIAWYWVAEGWFSWLFWGLCCAVMIWAKLGVLRMTTNAATSAWSHDRWRDSSDGSENFTRGRMSGAGLLVFVGAALVHTYS